MGSIPFPFWCAGSSRKVGFPDLRFGGRRVLGFSGRRVLGFLARGPMREMLPPRLVPKLSSRPIAGAPSSARVRSLVTGRL